MTGSAAAFWACVLAASLYGAVRAARVWRGARKPPAPGPAVVPPNAPAAAAAPGHIDTRLLGTCYATTNWYPGGASVTYHHARRTRTVSLPAIGDDDIRALLDGEAAP